MRYFKKIILVVIMSAFICLPIKAEMTLKELFFDESKPFHLKILDVIPEEGIVQIGDENACLLYTSPSPRDVEESRMPSSA